MVKHRRTWTERETICFEVDDGHESINTGQWEVDVTFEGHTERFGEDADGNRGEDRDYIDDYEIEELRAPDDRVVAWEEAPKIVRDAGERAIEKS